MRLFREERGRLRRDTIVIFRYRKGCHREKGNSVFFSMFLITRIRNDYLNLHQGCKEISEKTVKVRLRSHHL